MSVTIPDDILTAAKMTAAELKREIAILLYQQHRISGGKARELADMNIIEFRRECARRGININYDVEDFQADIQTLKSLGRL